MFSKLWDKPDINAEVLQTVEDEVNAELYVYREKGLQVDYEGATSSIEKVLEWIEAIKLSGVFVEELNCRFSCAQETLEKKYKLVSAISVNLHHSRMHRSTITFVVYELDRLKQEEKITDALYHHFPNVRKTIE